MTDIINYDPDGKPDFSEEMIEEARRNGMHLVNVICDTKCGVARSMAKGGGLK